MPAYHSNQIPAKSIANVGLLPLRCTTKFRGPAPRAPPNSEQDVIDEALYFYRANIFFRNYDIKGDADRTLIYVTLYLQQCLKKLQRTTTKEQGRKEMYSLAVSPFDIPGDPGFPLNAMYAKPQSRQDADQMKAYFQQIRHEAGERLLDKVYDPSTNSLNKWWICYSKRRFMDKSLSAPGQ
ncbi:actin-related protein 2/3 complex subunit 3-like [Styela clava]|uniref:actin-related protein 2/3 complex subunit 3-like n=1 Tax=Styela clava TaxID=7725 RepID=UPI00193A35DD|nr:actin-related protein 2/3 complex subunit 3-like [Styela clava]